MAIGAESGGALDKQPSNGAIVACMAGRTIILGERRMLDSFADKLPDIFMTGETDRPIVDISNQPAMIAAVRVMA
jgi:hypothetical protein